MDGCSLLTKGLLLKFLFALSPPCLPKNRWGGNTTQYFTSSILRSLSHDKFDFYNYQSGVFLCVEFESGFWGSMWGFVPFSREALGTMKKCEWTFHKQFTPLKYETKQKHVIVSALLYADSIKFWLRVDQCGVRPVCKLSCPSEFILC